jgi:tetratricopeptide (TPR) repeat protein
MVWLGALLFPFWTDECSGLLSRGRFAYETRNYSSAILEFERALTACPDSGPLLLPLAQAQLLGQQVEAAVATLKRIDPRNVAALKLRADAVYILGDEPEAEKLLLQALAIEPRHEQSLYTLGRIYYQQNRHGDAAERFKQTISVNPKSYKAYDNLALCNEALGQDDLALRNYLQALDLVYKDHPEYDPVYANMADFYLRREQYEKAFQLAAEAARRNPSSARNFFLTGKALVKLDKQELSVRWLEQAIALDPEYPEPRYLLGQVYRKLGRQADATAQLERFQELRKKPRARR